MPLIDFSTASLPGGGDVNPGGGGLTTSSKTSEQVLIAAGEDEYNGMVVGTGLLGTPAGHPIAWWIGMGVLLVGVKFLAEKNSEGTEFKNIRVGFFNIAIITLSAIFGMTLAKWVFGVYKVPGLSAIVEAA